MNRSRIEIHVDGLGEQPEQDLIVTGDKTAAAALILRVKAEFLEMPGLKLTGPQACRLWTLDAASCSNLLDAMVKEKFLFRTRDGAFMHIERAAPSKASPTALKAPASAA